MKRLLAVLLMIMLPAAGFAESGSDVPVDWLEMSADDCVLTIRLPWDPEDGCEWRYENLDDETHTAPLELLTQEIIGDEAAERDLPGMWAASFACFAGQGASALRLTYGAAGEQPQDVRLICLNVADGGALTVTSVEEAAPQGIRCALDESGGILTVCVSENASTGYAWSYEAPDALGLLDDVRTQHDSDGLLGSPVERTLRFRAAEAQSDDAFLTLRYARRWEGEPLLTHSFRLGVSQDGKLKIAGISTYDVRN